MGSKWRQSPEKLQILYRAGPTSHPPFFLDQRPPTPTLFPYSALFLSTRCSPVQAISVECHDLKVVKSAVFTPLCVPAGDHKSAGNVSITARFWLNCVSHAWTAACYSALSCPSHNGGVPWAQSGDNRLRNCRFCTGQAPHLILLFF